MTDQDDPPHRATPASGVIDQVNYQNGTGEAVVLTRSDDEPTVIRIKTTQGATAQ